MGMENQMHLKKPSPNVLTFVFIMMCILFLVIGTTLFNEGHPYLGFIIAFLPEAVYLLFKIK